MNFQSILTALGMFAQVAHAANQGAFGQKAQDLASHFGTGLDKAQGYVTLAESYLSVAQNTLNAVKVALPAPAAPGPVYDPGLPSAYGPVRLAKGGG